MTTREFTTRLDLLDEMPGLIMNTGGTPRKSLVSCAKAIRNGSSTIAARWQPRSSATTENNHQFHKPESFNAVHTTVDPLGKNQYLIRRNVARGGECLPKWSTCNGTTGWLV